MIQVSKSFKLFSSSLIRRPRLDCISLYNVSDEGIFVDLFPAIKLLLNTETSEFCPLKEAREGFRCCSVCETIEDYKEGYLMVWTTCLLAALLLGYTLRVLVTSYKLPWQRTTSTKVSSKFQFL